MKIIKKIISRLKSKIKPTVNFDNSTQYWEDRYKTGGNSGAGSYNNLANFKAKILNEFIINNNVKTVVEFGCGDGNQLLSINYPRYTGLDISPTIVNKCKNKFKNDSTKIFEVLNEDKNYMADLSLSLDVLFHLVEKHIFENYLKKLFSSANKFVIIYSSNKKSDGTESIHVKHREITNWISDNITGWKLIKKIDNPYPFDANNPDTTSFCDFYIYQKNI